MPARTSSWAPTILVRVDDDYDTRNASDRHSRYSAYLANRADWFHEYGEPNQPLPPAEFAAAAWKVASSPAMSPGYVRIRPDLGGITPAFSEDGEGRLLFDVQVPLDHHDLRAECRTHIPYTWRDWQRGSALDTDSSGPYWPRWEPDSQRPALLTTAVVRLVADDGWSLVTPQHTTGRGLVDDAKRAVAVLAENINKHGGSMVAALRGER
ncbi:hypothetical protein [Streptomyces sp. STR69]|uniref:hypothetical protein n=1 Tax=Streptomyces sp. STR69 TaxID=1796942 RepID=UPI0021CA6807|nr:hypothetical protein [Streptomyces sp. STR69]